MQLCSDVVYSDDVCSGYYVQVYHYDCIGCHFATTLVCSAQEAENQIKDLIFRFPFIMRVWPGDKVVWENTLVTILDKNVQYGELLVINSQGSKFLLDPQDIEKWPWEIEQKGDANGNL